MKAEARSNEIFALALERRSPTESEKYLAKARRGEMGLHGKSNFFCTRASRVERNNNMPLHTLIIS
ncbi:MAG: hypothetical protein U1F83_12985 [Verrucomicrobiota bacterium]